MATPLTYKNETERLLDMFIRGDYGKSTTIQLILGLPGNEEMDYADASQVVDYAETGNKTWWFDDPSREEFIDNLWQQKQYGWSGTGRSRSAIDPIEGADFTETVAGMVDPSRQTYEFPEYDMGGVDYSAAGGFDPEAFRGFQTDQERKQYALQMNQKFYKSVSGEMLPTTTTFDRIGDTDPGTGVDSVFRAIPPSKTPETWATGTEAGFWDDTTVKKKEAPKKSYPKTAAVLTDEDLKKIATQSQWSGDMNELDIKINETQKKIQKATSQPEKSKAQKNLNNLNNMKANLNNKVNEVKDSTVMGDTSDTGDTSTKVPDTKVVTKTGPFANMPDMDINQLKTFFLSGTTAANDINWVAYQNYLKEKFGFTTKEASDAVQGWGAIKQKRLDATSQGGMFGPEGDFDDDGVDDDGSGDFNYTYDDEGNILDENGNPIGGGNGGSKAAPAKAPVKPTQYTTGAVTPAGFTAREAGMTPSEAFRDWRWAQFPGATIAQRQQAEARGVPYAGYQAALGRYQLRQPIEGDPYGWGQETTGGGTAAQEGLPFRSYLTGGDYRKLGDVRGSYGGLTDYLGAVRDWGASTAGTTLTDEEREAAMQAMPGGSFFKYYGGLPSGEEEAKQRRDRVLNATMASLGVAPGSGGNVYRNLASAYDIMGEASGQGTGYTGASFADWVGKSYNW